MQFIIYIILLPIIYLISILPFRILYILSDLIYLILYYVVGYRKQVVLDNLKNSFPNKNINELLAIRKDFYKHFCDTIVETIKTLTISKTAILKRCSFADDYIANLSAEKDKNIILLLGHLGNWEWGGAAYNYTSKSQLYVLYHPLSNKYFDKLLYKMRTRSGIKLIDMNKTHREFANTQKSFSTVAFIADQSPPRETTFWTNFLNQKTRFYQGAEKFAFKYDYAVMYIGVRKIRRGYYQIFNTIITNNPKDNTGSYVTEKFARLLEDDITLNPSIWLWSHRRWKHKVED